MDETRTKKDDKEKRFPTSLTLEEIEEVTAEMRL